MALANACLIVKWPHYNLFEEPVILLFDVPIKPAIVVSEWCFSIHGWQVVLIVCGQFFVLILVDICTLVQPYKSAFVADSGENVSILRHINTGWVNFHPFLWSITLHDLWSNPIQLGSDVKWHQGVDISDQHSRVRHKNCGKYGRARVRDNLCSDVMMTWMGVPHFRREFSIIIIAFWRWDIASGWDFCNIWLAVSTTVWHLGHNGENSLPWQYSTAWVGYHPCMSLTILTRWNKTIKLSAMRSSLVQLKYHVFLQIKDIAMLYPKDIVTSLYIFPVSLW